MEDNNFFERGTIFFGHRVLKPDYPVTQAMGCRSTMIDTTYKHHSLNVMYYLSSEIHVVTGISWIIYLQRFMSPQEYHGLIHALPFPCQDLFKLPLLCSSSTAN